MIKFFDENEELSESYLFEKKQEGDLEKVEARQDSTQPPQIRLDKNSKSVEVGGDINYEHDDDLECHTESEDGSSIYLSKSSPVRIDKNDKSKDTIGLSEMPYEHQIVSNNDLRGVIHDYLQCNRFITASVLEFERNVGGN